jgi:hypothetical protein
VAALWNYPTVAELADYLGGLLELVLDADEPAVPASPHTGDARAAEVAAMADEAVLELLGEKLRGLEEAREASGGRP